MNGRNFLSFVLQFLTLAFILAIIVSAIFAGPEVKLELVSAFTLFGVTSYLGSVYTNQ